MVKVTDIVEKQPHIVLNCGDKVHVLPICLLKDVVEGRKCFTEIEYWQDLIKPILTTILEV